MKNVFLYNVEIVRVVDGDTVEVDIDLGFEIYMRNQIVRLNGIDAPESRTTDSVEKKFGLKAKEVVEQMLPVGAKVQMVSILKGGKFGRILGEFLIEDPAAEGELLNLNRWLVENHYAVSYDGSFSRDKLKGLHRKNRKILTEQGLVK